jgi:hypothetical protein
MPERLAAGSASAEARFRFAIDWRTSARRRNPNVEDAVLDGAYDGLIDALLKRADLGNSRKAVWALGDKQLRWKIASSVRRRLMVDGHPRPTPAGAASLDAMRARTADGNRPFEPVGHDDVAETVLRRVTFRALLADATRKDPLTATIVVGYAIGYGPNDLAERLGVNANTITQRKGRFERAHREVFE